MPDLIQIPKPELGRPNDSRLTQAYLDARPELRGLTPFNPGTDIDLVDAVNDRLGQLHALVQYADPDLHGEVIAARDGAVQATQDAQAAIDAIPAQVDAALAPVPVALADIAQDRAATQQLAADLTNQVQTAGTQALALRVGVTYGTDAQRVAAAPADGTTAYVLETRVYWERSGGTWVNRGVAVLGATDAAVRVADLAALQGYAGTATMLAVMSGPAAGLWARDDVTSIIPGWSYTGVAPRRWRRAGPVGVLPSDWYLTTRTVTLTQPTTRATDLGVSSASNVTSNGTDLTNTLNNWSVGRTLSLDGRGSVPVSTSFTRASLSNQRLAGYGTDIVQTKANTRLIQFSGVNLTFEGLTLTGNGTDYLNDPNNNNPRLLYAAGQSVTTNNIRLLNSRLRNFGYAGNYAIQTARTWTVGSVFEGPGEYDATTNPTGITNGLSDGDIEKGNYNFGEMLAGLGTQRDGNGNVTAEYYGHWRIGNYYTKMGTAIDTAADYFGLFVIGNYIEDVVGQHGMYLGGVSGAAVIGNVIRKHVYDAIKNQLDVSTTLGGAGNAFIGNIATGGRSAAWCLSLSYAGATTLYHRATVVAGNVGYDTLSGGLNARRHRQTLLATSVYLNTGRYNVYTEDFAGDLADLVCSGSDYVGAYLGSAAGERITVRGLTVRDYAKNPSQTDTTLRAALRLGGAGTVRLSGVRVGTAGTAGAYTIYADAATTVELDGSNTAPSTQPSVILGAITAINGDHIGPIYSNTAGTTPYNFADGVVRQGRGPGREFNASAAPTTGTYRARDICWNTALTPGSPVFWICTVGGTPGTWQAQGTIS